MAVIPRYFSESNTTPAINQVKADPSEAAAPYKAAASSIGHIVESLQGELHSWGQVLEQKKKEQQAAEQKNRAVSDGIYKAQAAAQASVASSDIRRRALSSIDGVSNPADAADQEFQQLADGLIANAPSDEARLAITQRLIGQRASLYSHISDGAIQANNQFNMDRLEETLSQYEAGAASNPESVGELKAQSGDIFKAMSDLGLPGHVKAKIESKFHSALDYHAAAAQAETDPFGMKQRLEAGELASLGASAQTKLAHTINSSLKAATIQAKSSLKDVEDRIMSGMSLPKDFESRAQLAVKAGLTTELEDVVRLVDVSKLVQGKKLEDLVGVSAELGAMTSSSNPKKIKKLMQFVDTSIKAIKEDPFGYAENQGSFQPFTTITDFTKISVEDLQKRSYRALQVQESLGVESPALRKSELKIAAQQLESLPPEEKSKVLGNLAQLGDSTIKALSKLIDKKDGGLAQAIRMHTVDPEVSMDILKGRDLLKTGKGPTKMDMDQAAEEVFKHFPTEDPELRSNMVRAGTALHANDLAQGKTVTLAESISRANNMLTVDRNGMFTGKYRTVAPAAGMSAKELDSLVDKNLVNNWKDYSGGKTPARTETGLALPANRFKPSDFDYISTRSGKYKVMYEGSPVLDVDGQPLVTDLRKLYKDTSVNKGD